MNAPRETKKTGQSALNIGPAKGIGGIAAETAPDCLTCDDWTPRIKVVHTDNGWTIKPDHPDELIGRRLLMKAVGTANGDFLDGLLLQMLYISAENREPDPARINFLLSFVASRKPNDETEALLLTQMAMGHWATMNALERFICTYSPTVLDIAGRATFKLMQLLLVQMDALKRYRAGQPTVTVQHVSVNDNAQAVVANVTQTTCENMLGKAEATSAPALTHDKNPPMPIREEANKRAAIPVRFRPPK